MMTQTFFKTALIASAAILLTAAGPKADLNQDGQVTKAEFTQAAQSKFFATDTNNDGFLSQDEREAKREARLEDMKNRRFARLDADNDGLISRSEMDARGERRESRRANMRAKMLEKYDTNLDGKLSDAERTVIKAERKEKLADVKSRREGRKNRRADRPKLDPNGDGFISMDEYMSVSNQLFDRMDADGDGVLTKGEGRKRKGKRGQKRGR